MVETALVMPVLVLMLCFAIDIGYFFIVSANLVSSARSGVLYSGQGFVSPAQQQIAVGGYFGFAQRYRRGSRTGGRRSFGPRQYDNQDHGGSLLQEDRRYPDFERLCHELQHLPVGFVHALLPTRTPSPTTEC
jgi:hypothetical protein